MLPRKCFFSIVIVPVGHINYNIKGVFFARDVVRVFDIGQKNCLRFLSAKNTNMPQKKIGVTVYDYLHAARTIIIQFQRTEIGALCTNQKQSRHN